MDQHPVPRQITTFEFKLIGFMTLKQFLYLVVSVPSGYIVFLIFPIPILNILAGIMVAMIGVGFAFVPIQDRPMDVWLKNLLKRLTSPTQYFYHKSNKPLYFLSELYYVSDPHKVSTFIESKEKLAAYLQQRKALQSANAPRKQSIQTLLKQNAVPQKQVPVAAAAVPSAPLQPAPGPIMQTDVVSSQQVAQSNQPLQQVIAYDVHQSAPQPPGMAAVSANKHPFFIGVIKSSKQFPLPGILIYVKDTHGTPLRLLKTNPNGVFATYSPLPPGEYFVEMKDPNGKFFFDTMKIRVQTENLAPFQFYSKELL